jgi:4-oxalocrotonate tautomerase family enzyme
MPYVNIRITKGNTTAAQKAALIAGVTELLASVLGKSPATTFVIIDEVDSDNWGIAGQSVTERRALPHARPLPEIINGGESHDGLATPLDALIAFYAAFNQRDLASMADVWLAGHEPSMDNPIGGIRRGWSEIEAGYRKLFDGPARVQVEFYDYTMQLTGDTALAVGRERGTCTVGDETLQLAIRTSRLFVKRSGQWQQLHHHGSVEDASLLASYQSIIGKGLSLPTE